MSSRLEIKNVRLSQGSVDVEWGDGHISNYDARYLRINCGCAECVDEWSKRSLLDPATLPADIHAEDYLIVGQYAIQLLWSDTHYTGIYPFDLLMDICQCPQCSDDPMPSKNN